MSLLVFLFFNQAFNVWFSSFQLDFLNLKDKLLERCKAAETLFSGLHLQDLCVVLSLDFLHLDLKLCLQFELGARVVLKVLGALCLNSGGFLKLSFLLALPG